MTIYFVLIVGSVYLEGRDGWMVRHLLAVYSLPSRLFALQGLAQDRVEGHLAGDEGLVHEVICDEESDDMLDPLDRILRF